MLGTRTKSHTSSYGLAQDKVEQQIFPSTHHLSYDQLLLMCRKHTQTHTHTSGKEDMGITWNAHLLAWGPWTLGGTIIALG